MDPPWVETILGSQSRVRVIREGDRRKTCAASEVTFRLRGDSTAPAGFARALLSDCSTSFTSDVCSQRNTASMRLNLETRPALQWNELPLVSRSDDSEADTVACLCAFRALGIRH